MALRAYLARVRNWLGANGSRGSEESQSSDVARAAAPTPAQASGDTGRSAETAEAGHEDLPQPALGGLKRILHETEIAEIADNLITSGQVQPTRADVAVAITKLINELPGERDMELVRAHLEAAGFPPLWADEDETHGDTPPHHGPEKGHSRGGGSGPDPTQNPDPDPAGKDDRDR